MKTLSFLIMLLLGYAAFKQLVILFASMIAILALLYLDTSLRDGDEEHLDLDRWHQPVETEPVGTAG